MPYYHQVIKKIKGSGCINAQYVHKLQFIIFKHLCCFRHFILLVFCRMRSLLTGLYDIIIEIFLLKELNCLYKQSLGGGQNVIMSL